MKRREYEKELDAIMNNLAESITELTDDEIIEDYIECGKDPDKAADQVREVLLGAVNSYQKRNLTIAKEKYRARLQEIKNSLYSIPTKIDERRKLLSLIFSKKPYMQDMLTAQYRDFKNLSDSDIENLLQQLKVLGALDDLSEE